MGKVRHIPWHWLIQYCLVLLTLTHNFLVHFTWLPLPCLMSRFLSFYSHLWLLYGLLPSLYFSILYLLSGVFLQQSSRVVEWQSCDGGPPLGDHPTGCCHAPTLARAGSVQLGLGEVIQATLFGLFSHLANFRLSFSPGLSWSHWK